MKNEDLKEIYNEQKLNWHNGFNESMMICQMLPSWKGKTVREIGCGKGHLAAMLNYAGAIVTATDYAENELREARRLYGSTGITFLNKSIPWLSGAFDVIVMQGVLEHLDDPWEKLAWLIENRLNPGGCVVLSVPNWINPRGYVYHTCRLLFGAKMSLTDIHFFLPNDFEAFCINHELFCSFASSDPSWAGGDECIADFQERLPKACPEVNEENIQALLEFLKRALKTYFPDKLDGANLGVVLSPKLRQL